MEDGDSDGIGIHTYNVLLNNQKNKDSQGNGALMRVLPFAIELIKDGYSLDKAVKMMDTDSFLTHKNKTISISNKLCLDVAVNGLEVLNKQEYSDIISKMHYGSDAWVIHTLYIIIQTLKKDLSFLDGFKYIVSKGGDTDTNCAIYGAIKSAKEDIKDSLDIYKFLDKESLELIGENDDGR
jgi:ADP-ribosylglycohydrolase